MKEQLLEGREERSPYQVEEMTATGIIRVILIVLAMSPILFFVAIYLSKMLRFMATTLENYAKETTTLELVFYFIFAAAILAIVTCVVTVIYGCILKFLLEPNQKKPPTD
ncbi:hypothetical protein [Aneurinibacillus tyrosinisolvens]|uniref:hypothetical protein n=1 Tax=Aneurinibacillus tyrosinisolvens TaxID=1443435 RepID=UPI00128C45A7|nr:hypothetical protein [Aneurinibacillus tyrosinisolvens]